MKAQDDLYFDNNCLGQAEQAAWDEVLSLDETLDDTQEPDRKILYGARAIALSVSNANTYTLYDARIKAAARFKSVKRMGSNEMRGADDVLSALGKLRCANWKSKDKTLYAYPTWLPTFGTGCTSDAILNFFDVDKNAVTANNVQYLYNAQQGTSQVNADLITATFPGFQAVLASTATAGSSQTSSTTAGGATATTTTDSVPTAVAKIENGGDFNVRFPIPILYHDGINYLFDGKLIPNAGFIINGFGAQSTITQSSEYNFNVPFEFYAQTSSIDPTTDGSTSAILFLDIRPSAEVISSQLAQAIGLTGPRDFFLGQASAGIEFNQNIRISFQYFYGPEEVYTTPNSTTKTSSRIQGLHLAVSFSPPKSKAK